jgi:hypothetical protein
MKHEHRIEPRRSALGLLAVGTLAALAGCAGSALPPIVWLRLPLDPPVPLPPPPRPGPPAGIELLGDLSLPGHLDRDAVLVPQGAAVLAPLAGLRWAEPLRDALPRLLRADLAAALGAPVWAAPLPAGVRPTRQLRVRLLALDLAEGARSLRVRAEWVWSTAPSANAPVPAIQQAEWNVVVAGGDGPAIALAHRAALAELARRIAVSAAG